MHGPARHGYLLRGERPVHERRLWDQRRLLRDDLGYFSERIGPFHAQPCDRGARGPRMLAAERQRIGVHTCPGGDRDSTHSADVDYVNLLPHLFRMKVGRFYIQLASETDRRRVLGQIQKILPPGVILFVGVTDPISASFA